MGAWGTGIFDDDTTCDFFDSLSESEPISLLAAAFDHANDDYLEYENGAGILVSAAVIDSILNGINHDPESEEYTVWINNNKKLP